MADISKIKLSNTTYDLKDLIARAGNATAESNAKTYADEKIAQLVGSAPQTLDTIYEIAEAIEDNADVVDALDQAIGNKVDKVSGANLIRIVNQPSFGTADILYADESNGVTVYSQSQIDTIITNINNSLKINRVD